MAGHSYIRVRWLHSSPDDPIELWSELDVDRAEVRKVEMWADGRIGYASDAEEGGGTRLGEIAVPSLSEINLDPQFRAGAVAGAEFESRWIDAIGKH